MVNVRIGPDVGELTGHENELIGVDSSANQFEFKGAVQTYTPTVTLVGGAGNTTPVYTTNSGRYFRLGNMVFVDILLDGDGGAEGAGTGVINISLPVASGASANDGNSWIHLGSFRNGTAEYMLYGVLGQSDSTLALVYFDTCSNVSTVIGDLQNNTSRMIRINFFYEVD